ncbi:MAG: hypothetical protein HY318_06735 [Armatimonadetes bacterium]|nr:hypothetical protein [Armatimonadota bacterium]
MVTPKQRAVFPLSPATCYLPPVVMVRLLTRWVPRRVSLFCVLMLVAPAFSQPIRRAATQRLTGTVLTPRGTPAVRADMRLTTSYNSVQTDETGQFVLETAPADRDYKLFILAADKKSGAVVTVKRRTHKIRIKLLPTCDVSGRALLAKNKPASGLQFFLYPSVDNRPVMLEGLSFCKADKAGRFMMTGLVPDLTYVASWFGRAGYNENYADGNRTFSVRGGVPVTFHVKRFVDHWKAPGNIGLSAGTRIKRLTNFCLDNDDKVLACDGGKSAIRVISLQDELLAVWPLGFSPEAISCREDGSTVVAGSGKIALLNKTGKIVRQAPLPAKTATSVGWSGEDIFVCVQKGTGYGIYRMDSKLGNQKLIIKGLRGCCNQMDFTARNGALYVAANSVDKIVKYDRDGRELDRFGPPPGKEKFGGCCEPKNVCFDSAGILYAAESDECRVKRFSPEGEYLGTVGTLHGIRGCVRVTIALTKDRSRLYMLDAGRSVLRVLRLPGTSVSV